jgi:hypothetical protein
MVVGSLYKWSWRTLHRHTFMACSGSSIVKNLVSSLLGCQGSRPLRQGKSTPIDMIDVVVKVYMYDVVLSIVTCNWMYRIVVVKWIVCKVLKCALDFNWCFICQHSYLSWKLQTPKCMSITEFSECYLHTNVNVYDGVMSKVGFPVYMVYWMSHRLHITSTHKSTTLSK